MSRYRLNHEAVVEGAAELVNVKGADALSLAELAARFRVRTPSLYNHIQGLTGLQRDLALYGLRELDEVTRSAAIGLAGRDALEAVAAAYRDFARQNPGVYAFTLRTVEDADDELREAGGRLLDLLLTVLRGYKLGGDQTIHAARAVRSALHGFVSVEAAGGFGLPVDVDESFQHLVEMLDAGLRNWAARPGRRPAN